MAGICFVGIENHWMKKGFVLVPFGVCLVIGEVLMVRGTIINQFESYEINSNHLSHLFESCLIKLTQSNN